eukprot:scaffold1675_cov146-Skeletonema_menzelii.AAC.10
MRVSRSGLVAGGSRGGRGDMQSNECVGQRDAAASPLPCSRSLCRQSLHKWYRVWPVAAVEMKKKPFEASPSHYHHFISYYSQSSIPRLTLTTIRIISTNITIY